eukprot:752779-Hanusia_phi.AAC.7
MYVSRKVVIYLVLHAATLLVARESCIGGKQVDVVAMHCVHEHGGIYRSPVLRLSGAGRAWIRKKVKSAVKKERQRKKRNIENTNLRASVKLDPKRINKHVLLQMHLEERALEWIRAGCNHSDMPVVDPVKFFEGIEYSQNQSNLAVEGGNEPETLKIEQPEEEKRSREGKTLEESKLKMRKKLKLSAAPDTMALRGGKGQRRGGGSKQGGRGRERGSGSKPPMRGLGNVEEARTRDSEARQHTLASTTQTIDQHESAAALDGTMNMSEGCAGTSNDKQPNPSLAKFISADHASDSTGQPTLEAVVETSPVSRQSTLEGPPAADPALGRRAPGS